MNRNVVSSNEVLLEIPLTQSRTKREVLFATDLAPTGSPAKANMSLQYVIWGVRAYRFTELCLRKLYSGGLLAIAPV